jgi:MurNAc alpha-1-phosphate uridylyltransferase
MPTRPAGPSPVKALLLAAGAGTRLLPLTATIPKPLLPVRGRPLIEYLIEALVQADVRELVINLFHLGERIEAHLGDGSDFGVRIQYSRETRALETGGGIVNALPLLGDDPFLIANGDILTSFDFRDLLPLAAGDLAHLVLVKRPAFRDTGDFECVNGRVTERGNTWVYGGMAIVRPELFRDAPPAPFSWNVLMWRAAAEGRLSAQIHDGQWLDIGTPEQYAGVC